MNDEDFYAKANRIIDLIFKGIGQSDAKNPVRDNMKRVFREKLEQQPEIKQELKDILGVV